jgi:hypothetical protein
LTRDRHSADIPRRWKEVIVMAKKAAKKAPAKKTTKKK